MATHITVVNDLYGTPLWGINFTDQEQTAYLSGSTEATVVVPTDCNIAILSYQPGVSCYISTSTISALPSSATFSNTGAKLNPAAIVITDSDTLHLMAASDAYVSITFGKYSTRA